MFDVLHVLVTGHGKSSGLLSAKSGRSRSRITAAKRPIAAYGKRSLMFRISSRRLCRPVSGYRIALDNTCSSAICVPCGQGERYGDLKRLGGLVYPYVALRLPIFRTAV